MSSQFPRDSNFDLGHHQRPDFRFEASTRTRRAMNGPRLRVSKALLGYANASSTGRICARKLVILVLKFTDGRHLQQVSESSVGRYPRQAGNSKQILNLTVEIQRKSLRTHMSGRIPSHELAVQKSTSRHPCNHSTPPSPPTSTTSSKK